MAKCGIIEIVVLKIDFALNFGIIIFDNVFPKSHSDAAFGMAGLNVKKGNNNGY